MTVESSTWFSDGAGTIALALLSGAGGSALLELLWRPRRAQRRVAALLVVEIEQNTNLLAVFRAMVAVDKRSAGADFGLSTLVWSAAQESLAELPEDVLRDVVALYGTYHEINADIGRVDRIFDEWDPQPFNRSLRDVGFENRIGNALDVIGATSSKACDIGRSLSVRLRKLAKSANAQSALLSDEHANERAKKRLAAAPPGDVK